MSLASEQAPRQGQPWTRAEDDVVVDFALRSSAWKFAARKLGRTETAVVQRARDLRAMGVSVPRKSRSHERRQPWTAEQRSRLKAGVAAKETTAEIAKAIGRSVKSVRAEVWRTVGAQAYTRRRPKQIAKATKDALKLASDGHAVEEVAEKLGVSVSTVRRWTNGCGQNIGRWKWREYSLTDDDRIRAGYARTEPVKSIAADLGRSVGSVRMRAKKLGVTPIRKGLRRPWSRAAVMAALAEYESGMTYAEVGKKHGRSRASVKAALDAHRRRQ